jgi:PAS domain S-box-containing protein
VLTNDELLKLAVDATTGYAIFALDQNGRVLTWNAGAERLLGHTGAEMLGESGDVIFTPEDRARGAPQEERAQARASGRAEDERWHIRKDGSRFWSSGLLVPLPDAQGFLKIMRDQTEKHRAEEQLRGSETRFRTLATAIPQLVFTSRGDGSRTWGSPQWILYTGIDGRRSLEFGWLEAVHPEDREPTLEKWLQAQQTGQYDVQHRIRHAVKDQYRWHQTRATPLQPEDPAHSEWVGTSTDIHDLKALQDSQQVLLAELQHRTRNLLSMVRSVAKRSARASSGLEQFLADFDSRMRALSRAESLLPISEQGTVDIRVLLDTELAAHRATERDDDKVTISGEHAEIPANVAQVIMLAVHELATNAAKHGALKYEGARLEITWRVESMLDDSRMLHLTWREMGVPIAAPFAPQRQGYGTELLQRALPYQFDAQTRLEVNADGVSWQISVPASNHHAR